MRRPFFISIKNLFPKVEQMCIDENSNAAVQQFLAAPVPPVIISKAATAKEILAALDVWGGAFGSYRDWPYDSEESSAKNERLELWTILTALRGPDNGDDNVKRQTTQIIRNAVLPKLADAGGALVTDGRLTDAKAFVDDAVANSWRVGSSFGGIKHFFSHARRAVDLLLQQR